MNTPSPQKQAEDPKPGQPANIRPPAGVARMKRRHTGLIMSMVLVIVVPVVVTALYLTFFAEDQYVSKVGFTIRQEETGTASDLMGGLNNLIGGAAQGHSDLLFEFVQSQEIVERVSQEFDLLDHYSQTWPEDPVFSLWPTATIEDLLWFWGRMVRVTYDKSSGLMLVEVRARDPDSAKQIAQLIVSENERMINRLNEKARRDTMRHAESDLQAALERLRAAREALAKFRVRTQIVDPQADIQGRMGVLTSLQQQLAEALVEQDLLSESTDIDDPRFRQLKRRIEVLRNRITEERRSFTQQDVTVDETDYPQLIAKFESLQVDQSFAEATYQAALTALDSARSNASRQNLYLANFIQPTLAQRAEYPKTIHIIGLMLLLTTLLWGIVALVYYSLRDRG
ncbi:MAG: ABC2-type capsular polysaccharide export system periplasmic adaptor component KpsE [Halomonas sp. HL-93]|nr:MAG: ABC2-type capsular polysaccharide export system periplasmic adaptor component KpsE [Halomonas sp. HL-93]